MVTYIQKDIPGRLATFATALDPDLYNNIGSTPADFYAGKWVLLNDEQIEFAKANPHASAEEILDCALAVHTPSLEEARFAKIAEIRAYNDSPAVNSFSVNGSPMEWIAYDRRAILRASLQSEINLGRTEVTRWLGGIKFTMAPEVMMGMLDAIECYAVDAQNVTDTHIAAVKELTTVEAVNAFDITADYPDKPDFTL